MLSQPEALQAARSVQRAVVEQLGARGPAVRDWLARHDTLLGVAAQTIAVLASAEPETAPERLADRVVAAMRTRFAARAEIVAWFERSSTLLVLVAKAVALRLRAELAPRSTIFEALEVGLPQTPAGRTAANLRAIGVLLEAERKGRRVREEDRAVLKRYTGWGGLSIESIADQIPPELRPDAAGLLNEYYTPPNVCRALAELVIPRLPKPQGKELLALEPAAGIGRCLDAFAGQPLGWLACEVSVPAAHILRALHPDSAVFVGPFEAWVAANVRRVGQRLDLVVANPPFGERGASLYLDPDPSYREVSAASYFLRRCLDLLRPGGLGAFILPTGILTGRTAPLALLRRTVLKRHHLRIAFRLPSEDRAGRPTFPGASVVTDLVLFQARGFELGEVLPEDEPLVEGLYYEQRPDHVLGSEERSTDGGRERYRVIGDFAELRVVDGAERPVCTACTGRSYELLLPKSAEEEELPEPIADALKLARRTSRYLALYAKQTPSALRECAQLQPELAEALTAWHAQPQEALLLVFAQSSRHPELKVLSTVYGPSGLVEALARPPAYKAAFGGSADDIGELARWLYRERRGLTAEELHEEHSKLGGRRSLAEIRMAAAAVGFVPDGQVGGRTVLLSEADYYSGSLWPRYDRAQKLAASGDVKAQARAQRLMALINPAAWVDIQVEPRTGWLPERTLTAFAREWLRFRGFPREEIRLSRSAGRVEAFGSLGGKVLEEVALLRGYLNHDLHEFSPRRTKDEKLDEVRLRYAQELLTVWGDFIEGVPDHQAEIVETYNRLFRGFIQPAYDEASLSMGTWSADQPLRPYQNAGVRRLLAQRGGGLFFDVGLGKTRTILATLALARQEGWARRPILVVPNSVIWNWVAEIGQVLPDLRAVVIGSDRKQLTRGERKGQEVSETDSPAERAAKWQRFKAGLYDVALVTYSSLDRTALRIDEVTGIINSSAAVRRGVVLAQEDEIEVLEKLERKARFGKLSEREQKKMAELTEQLEGIRQLPTQSERQAALVRLRAERMAAEACDPGERSFDPGIWWTDLGCDFLVFDESHTGKNLWRAADREGGSPRYLASPAASSRIAWQMFYRAALVRKATGGTGIFLADATPAKNSPLELLSVLSILDSRVWERLGIADSEQFISTFLKIELRWVQNADLSIVQAPCVVGFRNLDQLRDVLLRYGEFRTAAQVGLKLPTPEVSEPIVVPLDELQEYKHRFYLKRLTALLAGTEKSAKTLALGIMTRLSLVALHPDLDGRRLELNGEPLPRDGLREAFKKAKLEEPGTFSVVREEVQELGWDEAATHPHPESPKIDEIARRVAQEQNCSHIIFCDVLAAQRFLQRRLVHFGVPAERIAFLNGVATKTPLERQRIAEAFNAGKYLVVIANAVAYEGVNLQRLTCAIWHADLPWEPATLQQRNGRGLRQGNQNESLRISYFLSERSVDMRRYALITGKRGWMVDVLESARSEANNPGAAVDLSPEEWIEFLARDKSEIAGLLEKVKAKQAERARSEARRSAWGKLRALAARTKALRTPEGRTIAERLERESAQLQAELAKVDAALWPFQPLVQRAREVPVLFGVGPEPGAVCEGMVAERSHGDRLEFGKVDADGQRIYARRLEGRSPTEWRSYDRKEVGILFGRHETGEPQTRWSFAAPEYGEEMRSLRASSINMGLRTWLQRNWPMGSESFLQFIWEDPSPLFIALGSSYALNNAVPLLDRDGLLLLWTHGNRPYQAAEVLPMTRPGFARFRELWAAHRLSPAGPSDATTAARLCALQWWGQELEP